MASTSEEKEQIRELLANYCFYSDAGRASAYLGLFTEDAELDLGPHGHFRGKAALKALQERKGGSPTSVRHYNTNIVISIDGAEAAVKSYVLAVNLGEQTPAMMFAGFYQDRLVKRDGTWLFQHRQVRTEPSDA
jgi:hypothetical protein